MNSNHANSLPQPHGASQYYNLFVLSILGFVSFFNYMDRALFAILAQDIKQDIVLTDTQLGLLGGFGFALFYAIMGLPLARLADTRPRVTLLSVCVGLWSLATALCGLASNFTQMFLARTLVGIGESGGTPTSYSIISDYFPKQRRAFAIGLFHAGGNLGVMFGLILAGVVADAYGWQMAFVALGLPGVLLALIIKGWLQEPPRGRFFDADTRHAVGHIDVRAAVQRLLRRPTYIHLMLGFSIGFFAYYGLLHWTPAFFIRAHGMSTSETGMFFGLAFGSGGVLGMTVGALLAPLLIRRDRRWEMWIVAGSFALSIPFYAIAFLLASTHIAMAFIFLAGLTVTAGTAPGLAAIQSVAEPNVRALATAIQFFVGALIGQGMGPFFVGAMSDALMPRYGGADGLRYALLLSLGAFAWGAAHLVLAARNFHRDRVD
ncbi:MAG: spinster family MFS transporter [Pseudomonadota bacterium]